MKHFHFRSLTQSNGLISPAYVGVDPTGLVEYLDDKPPAEPVSMEYVDGHALPGFPNAHSHAFQFAMAGMAERHSPGRNDDFWSWREAMYACALALDPDQIQSVAAMLYAEMLRKGYTHVAEFHYLHHDKNGAHYARVAETGERLVQAAKTAGINITLIPVFYQKGGFGKDPTDRQRRFISKDRDEYLQLLDATADVVRDEPHAALGFSIHSLRAVGEEDIVGAFSDGPKGIPFHLHAAEQLKEVDECLAWLKQRPVEWILNHLPADERFHLVHCTHMNDDEVERLAKSRAHVVLCPGTEGNLGDGIFRLTDFARHNGSWSIGTDSHISLNPLEDLRWLDYAQRFTTHRRNTFSDGAATLLQQAIFSGARAVGRQRKEFFEVGRPFDAVVFRNASPLLSRNPGSGLLPSIVYTADSSDVLGTIVNGKWMVKDQRHFDHERLRSEFKLAIGRIRF